MKIYEIDKAFILHVMAMFFIILFLGLLISIGSKPHVQLENLIVTGIELSDKDNCIYFLDDKRYFILDKCGKYKLFESVLK